MGEGARGPRPRRADGRKGARRQERWRSFRAWYGAGTAQRAIPTGFGSRVEGYRLRSIVQAAQPLRTCSLTLLAGSLPF